ncbi:MAG: ABC transporter ATP-binding protein [Synergistaceae bacterium]|jgi:peptide/nickel transport system ATP-binding protein/oligopeptide transport system ATP-binding protein|nr:ABC transporter ATP-binding protein [Synergistaceae bacterium]
MNPNDSQTLLIKNLSTHFFTGKGVAAAVDDVTLSIPRKSIVGVVGESGCGKSVTALSVLRLVSRPGRIVSGSVMLDGEELLGKSPGEMRQIRGNKISMIFQEPMTSLNPVYTVGRQVMEAMRIHGNTSETEARDRAVEMFSAVGIPEPEHRLRSFPHQLSGGLRQRVMIAMAMVCRPRLMIADEPTTALDVTIEAQILNLMKELEEKFDTSIMMITHNMGVVAEICDYVYVMYAGRIMEQADIFELFDNTKHPYTLGLLGSIPRYGGVRRRLYNIKGMVPSLLDLPKGCRFSPRCEQATPECESREPELYDAGAGHYVRCFLHANANRGEKQ